MKTKSITPDDLIAMAQKCEKGSRSRSGMPLLDDAAEAFENAAIRLRELEGKNDNLQSQIDALADLERQEVEKLAMALKQADHGDEFLGRTGAAKEHVAAYTWSRTAESHKARYRVLARAARAAMKGGT